MMCILSSLFTFNITFLDSAHLHTSQTAWRFSSHFIILSYEVATVCYLRQCLLWKNIKVISPKFHITSNVFTLSKFGRTLRCAWKQTFYLFSLLRLWIRNTTMGIFSCIDWVFRILYGFPSHQELFYLNSSPDQHFCLCTIIFSSGSFESAIFCQLSTYDFLLHWNKIICLG